MSCATKGEIMQRPWTPSPDFVLTDTALSHGAVRAYLCIMRLIKYKDGTACTASAGQVAAIYGVSVRTFFRHVDELVKRGHLAVKEFTGKPSHYILLNQEIAGQIEMFEPKPMTEVSRVTPNPMTKMSRVTPKPMTKMSRAPMTKMSRVKPVSLSRKEYPEEPGEENAANTTAEILVHEEQGEPPGEFSIAAAAFLSQHFDQETVKKLLRGHGAAKILHVKRQLAVRQSNPKNTPGLIRYALRQPIAEAAAIAAAREVLTSDRKAKEQAQDKAERRKRREAAPWTPKKPGEIWTWLDMQPDAEELRTAARKHVAQVSKGKVNVKGVTHLMQGYLWREYEKRRRAQFRQIAQG